MTQIEKIEPTENMMGRFMNKFFECPNTGCWLWVSTINHGGYGEFWVDGVFKRQLAHRFSFAFARGYIPNGQHVLHLCDVRNCVNPDHLFTGTNDDNIQDKVRKGRQARLKGEANPSSKLNENEVLSILKSQQSQRVIAKDYGVSQNLVHLIKSGKSWSHIQVEGEHNV